MKRLCIFIFVVTSQIGAVQAYAREHDLSRANRDRLGETLKRFLSEHKDAKCSRRAPEENTKDDAKRHSSPWVDCGLANDPFFEVAGLRGAPDSNNPFGELASFYGKTLVELRFTVDVPSIEALFPTLKEWYGDTSHVAANASRTLDSVFWTDRQAQVRAELVSIPPAIAESGVLRLERGRPGEGVLVTIRSRRTLVRRPLGSDLVGWMGRHGFFILAGL